MVGGVSEGNVLPSWNSKIKVPGQFMKSVESGNGSGSGNLLNALEWLQ